MRAGQVAARLRPLARWILDRPRTREVIAADSFRRFRRLSNPLRRRTGPPEPIKVRALGEPVFVRPGSADPGVLWSTFAGGYHLPPDDIEPILIWDLGANIGLTMADFATRFPQARVFGVELDPANAALARRNLEPFGKRCELIEAAVWTHAGTVRFRHRPGFEAGSKVAEEGEEVPALTLNELLARTGPPDYVKMDVEGAERRLLSGATDWASAVRSIKVELHGSYDGAECARDLFALGFNWVRVLPERMARDSVQGVRSEGARDKVEVPLTSG